MGYSVAKPLLSLSWCTDITTSVKFNPFESDMFATSTANCCLLFYDIRTTTPTCKVVMQTRTNSVTWNPLNSYNFTTANENSNLYTFDIRKIEQPLIVHCGFTSSILDVDYSPIGHQFVASSHDRSIRIFPAHMRTSSEIYSTKRMQHVLTVKFSLDGRYIFSGSNDMNTRLWKVYTRPKKENSHLNERITVRTVDHEKKIKTILEADKLKKTSKKNSRRKLQNAMISYGPQIYT